MGIDGYQCDSEERMLLKNATRLQKRNTNYFIALEIIVTLYFTSYFICLPAQQFFIYSRAAEKYQVADIMQKLRNNSACENSTQHTGNQTELMDLIQQESSQLFLYLGFASYFPAVLTNLFLGNISDRIGKKWILILSISGCFLREAIYVAVVSLDLRVEYLFIGNAIEGATGFFGAVVASACSIIADITPTGNDRAVKVTMLEATVAVTFGVSVIGTGYWLEFSPFFVPISVSTGICIIAIIATATLLPGRSSAHDNTVKRPIVTCPEVVCSKIPINGKIVLVGVICNTIGCAVNIGKSNFQILFLLNKPLCWTETTITLFTAFSVVLSYFVVLLTLYLLRSRIQDIGLAVFGAFCGIVSLSVMAFSKTNWMVYISAVVGVYIYAIVPMQKSVMSRLVPIDKQGSLFGNLASLEMLFTALSGLVYSATYTATEAYFPGLMYLVMAAMMGVIMILSSLMYIGVKNIRLRTDIETLIDPETSEKQTQ